jgi:Mg2+ and Co2+ transporter CorA
MTTIKKNLLILSITAMLVTSSFSALAQAVSGVSETISHIEKALIEVGKSDFNSAQAHMKDARVLSEKLEGNQDVIKQANAAVIQAQRQAKLGDVQKASDELNKSLVLYKSISQ